MFRVHPLIMSLGMSLVVLGFANAWQLLIVQTSSGVPPLFRSIGSDTWLGIAARTACSCSCRSRPLILLALRRTGYGRLLYAIGDNPIAARLSGARSWQVLHRPVRRSRRSWPRSPAS